MRVLALIPARGGSKGVPRKNVKPLGGRPLIAYTIDRALESQHVSDVVVTTDDDEIAEVAKAHGANVPFMRPKDLAGDTSTSLSVVQHALKTLPKRYEAVCLLQPTTPLRSSGLIDAVINSMRPDSDAVVTMRSVPKHYHPEWVYRSMGGLADRYCGPGDPPTRRQGLDETFIRDGSVYLTRVPVIEAGSLYGSRVQLFDNSAAVDVNIDTPEDWVRAEVEVERWRA